MAAGEHTVTVPAFNKSLCLADSVPGNPPDLLERFAFISDMLNPIYPFDTPTSNPTIYYDIPPMRWLRPSWDSVDGYQVQVARDIAFTDITDDWTSFESDTGALYSFVPNTFVPLRAMADNETYYWRVRVRHERYTGRSTDFHYGPWSSPFRFKLDSRAPMNLRASRPGAGRGPGVDDDIARVIAIWEACRRDFGAGGEMLFGSFGIADAFFAPVVSRFLTYGVAPSGAAGAYMAALWAEPAVREWADAARAETWRVARYET